MDNAEVGKTPVEHLEVGNVASIANPFQTSRTITQFSEGDTLLDIALDACPEIEDYPHAAMEINGFRIEREHWSVTRPHSFSIVTLTVRPADPLTLVALIAPLLGSAFTSGILLYALTAVVVVAYGYAMNALLKVDLPSFSNVTNKTQDLEPSRNKLEKFGVLPQILGFIKAAPAYISNPFISHSAGRDAFNAMLSWGMGVVRITDLRVGDTNINSLSRVEYTVIEGDEQNQNSNRFSKTNDQLAPREFIGDSTKSSYYGAYSNIYTLPDTAQIAWITMSFPAGSWVNSTKSGNYWAQRVAFDIQYRTNNPQGSWKTGYAVRQEIYDRGSFSRDYSIAFAYKAIYDIRVRIYPPNNHGKWVYGANYTLTYIRGEKQEDAVNLDNVTRLAVTISATANYTGAVGIITAMCKSEMLAYNGTNWANRKSNNPANVYRLILQGPSNSRPLADSRLNLSELEAWWTFCDDNGLTFNMNVDFQTTVSDLLNMVCTAGFATRTQVNGIWGVVIDTYSVPVQVFTPRNSWGFSGVRLFVDLPHALRIPFVDETNDFSPQERVIYRSGYNENNATNFEQVSARGITNPAHIFKFGNYLMASMILRPEKFTFSVDFENLIATVGDQVLHQDDAILVGQGSGRIKAKTPTSITMDVDVEYVTGKFFRVVVRKSDGSSIGVQVSNAVTGVHNVFDWVEPAGVAVGDLFAYGESGKEVQPVIIQNIEAGENLTAKITAVPYQEGVYDSIDGSLIPPYMPIISDNLNSALPVIEEVITDERAIIVSSSGELQVGLVVVLNNEDPRFRVEHIEFENRINGDTNWSQPQIFSRDAHSMRLSDIRETTDELTSRYDVRIRYRYSDGSHSPDVESLAHLIIGKSTPPADVENFTSTIVGGSIVLSWDTVDTVDIFGYEIRLGSMGSTWDTADPIVKTRDDTYTHGSVAAGSHIWFIKAADTSKNLSVNATESTLVIQAPAQPTDISVQVIDNNVLLRWAGAAGTFPIDYFEIRRGAVFASALPLNTIKGTFATLFETSAGVYNYWIVGYDVFGNGGLEVSVSAKVNEPPDFVLHTKNVSVFDGTITNGFVQSNGNLLVNVDSSLSAFDHYDNNAWLSPQDQIDAGYPIVAQPMLLLGSYEEGFDVNAVVSSIINVNLDADVLDGTVTAVVTVSTRLTELDDWTVHPAGEPNVFANSFQFVSVKVDFTGTAGLTGVMVVKNLTTEVKVKLITDQGIVDCIDTDPTGSLVTLNRYFLDISSITLSPIKRAGEVAVGLMAIYDFEDSFEPTTFEVYLFDANGNRKTGSVSWVARGA